VAILLSTSLASAADSNSLLDISNDGKLLACSNRDAGTVAIVDLEKMKKLHEIPVGLYPEGVTFLGDSHVLAVAVYGDDHVSILDADAGSVSKSIEVFDEPYSVVSSNDGTKLYCSLDFPGEVIEIAVAEAKITRSKKVGSFIRGLAIDDSGLIFALEYYTGIVRSIDEKSFEFTNEWIGSPQDNIARQIALNPRRNKAYLPHQRSLTNVAHGSGSIFPYISIADTHSTEEKRRTRIQMDSFRGTYVVANPWEVALSPDGRQLYVVFAGTNDMFACKVLDDDYREVEFAGLIRTGSNPRAVRVSSDNKHFYVYNALDFTVDEFSTSTLKKERSVTVAAWHGTDSALLGKKLFYTANPPMSSRRWISCSSCHPDGDSDGRTWQQPEGLRNTQALFGMKQTHPIHWSADRDEVHDFEHTIRSPLMQGRGLIRGKVNVSLGTPNTGLSSALDGLAEYANSHHFKLSPFSKGGLSEAAKRGQKLFLSETTQCAKCHSGAWYTDQKMHDVGTGTDDKSELLGPEYDTPTLHGIYRTAPYLHHGKAKTLTDVLTTMNPKDQHGKTSHLNEQQVNDLVEFLKALPFETPKSDRD